MTEIAIKLDNTITNVMIIGSMKSGTTSLFDYLIKHPEICPAIIKEPEYFSKKMGVEKYKKGQYIDLFNLDRGIHKFTLEASTGYTKFPTEKGVPERIKAYGLNPKFIYIVRNPFDRISSHYNFMKKNLDSKTKIDSLHSINISKYYTQIEEYRKYFPASSILILDFDELKNDPQSIYNTIFEFIGASKLNIEANYVVKNKTTPINIKKTKLKQSLYDISQWIPSYLKKFGNKILDFLYPVRQEKLTKKQVKRIKRILKEDMCNLKKIYNIDVAKWGVE